MTPHRRHAREAAIRAGCKLDRRRRASASKKNLTAQPGHDRGTLTRTYPPPSERHSSTQGAFASRSQRFARANMGRGRPRAPREEQGFRSCAPRAVGSSHLDKDERFTDVLGGGTGEATFLQ